MLWAPQGPQGARNNKYILLAFKLATTYNLEEILMNK